MRGTAPAVGRCDRAGGALAVQVAGGTARLGIGSVW